MADPTRRVTVAAFDFDGTLTDSGSVFPFLVAVRGWWPVLRAMAGCRPACFRRRSSGGSAADSVKETLFTQLLGGLPERRTGPRAAPPSPSATWDVTCGRTRNGAWSGTSARVTTRSSSRPRRSATSFHRVTCSGWTEWWRRGSPSVEAGCSPGGYEGKNCRGAEKYARLVVHLRSQGLLSNNGGEQPVLWAYGNSRGDLRLLNAADHGVDAGRLGRLGRLRQFPRLSEVARADSR